MALIVVFLFIYRPKIKSLSLGSIEKVILSFKTSSRYDFGVCVKCGKKIEEKDTIYCPNCGLKLNEKLF